MFEKSVHPRSQAVPGIMQILSHLSRHCYIYINYIYTPLCTSNYAYFYCLLNGQPHEIVCFLFESETNEEPTWRVLTTEIKRTFWKLLPILPIFLLKRLKSLMQKYNIFFCFPRWRGSVRLPPSYRPLLCPRRVTKIKADFSVSSYTAKTQYRKFETNIPRKGISRPQSQFPHSCVCERFKYSQDRSAVCCRKLCGQIVEIFKSLTDTWMWKLGLRPRNPFSGNREMGFSLQCILPVSVISRMNLLVFYHDLVPRSCWGGGGGGVGKGERKGEGSGEGKLLLLTPASDLACPC